MSFNAPDSFDDLLENPSKFGAPTFDEFCRNPDKYLGRDDDMLSRVDVGGKVMNNCTQRHIYEIEGFKTRKLEEVDRFARDHGIPLRELDYRPEVIPTGAGKCDILIKFMSKADRSRREGWAK